MRAKALLTLFATVAALLVLSGPTLAQVKPPAAPPVFPRVTDGVLPVFHHKDVVLDYQGLKYNPCNDVIIPSVVKTVDLQKPLGRYYMYYAPHNAPGGICLAYADSLEGPWKEYETNPVIGRDWQPHYKVSHVSGPHAIWIEEEKRLFLYYHGENDVTRFASSTDGIHFQYEGVAFTTKLFPNVSEASYARIFRYAIPGKDNRYIVLLMGNNRGTRRIYLAWSKNGRTWEGRQTPLVDPPPGTAQVAQAWYLPWAGKHYLVYHAHWAVQPLIADLQVSEVDPALEQSKYLGLLYDHTSAGRDNVAQMSPCIVEENGKLYLFTNIGPRLNQKIALAVANADRKPLARDPVPSETCLLFSYFVDNGEDGLHLATSTDGYRWAALNGGKSFLTPKVGKSKLMRDPCLLLGPDGTFQMVWTDSWNSRTIGHASSRDLIHWSEQQAIGVMEHEPTAMNCWAPEIVYDEAKQQYLIFWATTIPGRFPQTEGAGDGKNNHRMYSTTTKDFKAFTPTRLFFDGGFNVIDGTMLRADGKHYLIVKDETLKPVKKNLRIAVGASPEGPFGEISPPFTPDWVEGPSAVRLGEDYIVYFDCYRQHRYGAMRSRNLKDWEDVTSRVEFPKGTRHGTVLSVPKSVVDGLVRHDSEKPSP